ncbi:ABC transporter permease subunit [Pigmentibacter sp. JX0631]|uniref:ABC transporter permease subunit n=1 Tax=Pigmentibacter sp. JX0631 TaxID=2976982 RepID=UPI002469AE22|nr:ABC transporter permease subunit [Pigmentibacter sp. JX0631]WGL60670.1 ABC transporter permease subunit [Pigmentibacter sp. JX0631]
MNKNKNRKIKHFFSQKKAKFGLFLFCVIFLSSIFANFIANDQPIFLLRKIIATNEIKFYFPALINYTPSDYNLADAFIVDYQKLEEDDRINKNYNWALHPLVHWNPEAQTDIILSKPSKEHWLGTDNLGRDIFARLLYGSRLSLGFGISLWFISYTIGAFIGAMQGYFLGTFDFILERLKELSSIIPMLTMVILVTAVTKSQSFWIILFLVLIFGWMGIASQIRATVLTIKTREFCEAAKALGSSNLKILVKHILPNSLTPLITLSPFAIEGGVSLLAALDYLGFGLPPPTPSLGELMAQGRDNIQNAPWLLISPVITILCILVSISLIGQALREAFDPKMNS